MRQAFVETLVELAEQDKRILLLTGDLGFMVLEPFALRFPGQFFNVGVAEQHMVGMATGLAEAGFIPFVYSITPFAVLRPYEFIRNGPVRHKLPVRIIGVGGGFDYGSTGVTHHGLDDIGVMRVQPGITLVAPADAAQARRAFLATWDMPGPVYYRLGKDRRGMVPGLDGRFELGQAQLLGAGTDLLFLSTGNITAEVVRATEILAEKGVSCQVMVVASLNPPPTADLLAALARFKLALSVESHYINGGLGSLVCEVVAEHGVGCRVVRCGVSEAPGGISGSMAYLNMLHGLSGDRLASRAILELNR